MKTSAKLQSELVAGILSGTIHEMTVEGYTWRPMEGLREHSVHSIGLCTSERKTKYCDGQHRCVIRHRFPQAPSANAMYSMCRKVRAREWTIVDEVKEHGKKAE